MQPQKTLPLEGAGIFLPIALLSLALLCIAIAMLSYLFLPVEFTSFTIADNFGHTFRLATSRISLLLTIAFLLTFAYYHRRRIQQIVQDFFEGIAHPINLAIFRIVFFWSICQWIDFGTTARLSRLPADLRFGPFGLDWLMPILPVNETLALGACLLLFLCSFSAMVGLFTRTAAGLTAIVGVYALGVPQLYGNVGHNHHLLWIAALLSVSRCGDYLSVDAIRLAWRRADQGTVEPPAASKAFALPLRFVWLIIGSVYFFPGVRKFWASGVDWVFTDNFKFHLYRKWLELKWTFPFRVDHYPVLYQPAALTAILFEAAFFFLVFFPSLRPWIALIGFSFHSFVQLLMRISFWTLQMCYVSFVNWYAILNRIGRWLYPKDLYVLYDGNCKLCRRTIATLRMFEVFNRITYINALDQEAIAQHQLEWLDPDALLADMHAVKGRQTWRGYAAYRAIAARLPILWPILPLLYIWPIPVLGSQIYQRVAQSRTCSIPQPPASTAQASSPGQNLGTRAVVLVGTFLIAVNIPFGFAGIKSAWPFACYPTFEKILGPQRESIEMVALNSSGEEVSLKGVLGQAIPYGNYRGMVQHILGADQHGSLPAPSTLSEADLSQIKTRLTALWQVVARISEKAQQVEKVQFYRVKFWSLPEQWDENPADQTLMFELEDL